MAKFKTAVIVGGDSINIKGHGEFRGEVPFERYEKLVNDYPQLKDSFKIVEGDVEEKPETAEETAERLKREE